MTDKKFPRGGPQKFPVANFQYSTLTGLLVPAALSLSRKMTFTLKMTIFGYFQMQKDDTFSSQVSFILGANCRCIFILKNTVRVRRIIS